MADLIYLDESLDHLKEVLGRIRAAGLKLKPSKCQFLQEEVHFLGHLVSKDRVRTDPDKLKVLEQWPEMKSVTGVRSFLGLCSYYRRYIQHFAELAFPLVRLTCKDQPFVWDEKCRHSFQALKNSLINSDIMAYQQDEGKFISDTDASDFGIGAVLSQLQNGKERVIYFGSRALSKEERRYCVTRKELLAIIFFMKYYRHHLLGRKFLVRSDHQPLQWIFGLKDPTG